MDGELHVTFGAGQIGSPLATRLLEAGKRVRVAKRTPTGVPPGAETVLGDAADPAFCADAARGATAVYHCMNPPYAAAAWAEFVPRYMDNLIAAAGRAGARLIVLDNLYMLGRTDGRPMTEDTPMNPCSRKGEIRARAAERLLEAHRAGDVRAATGRASDFYGPGGSGSHLGEQFWRPAITGRPGRVIVDPDARHTYHYIPDVVAGLATLGTAGDDALGKVWMLPCQPAETMRALVDRFAQVLGRPIPITTMPRWLIRILAVFVPLVREVNEMLYQWDEPFIVDDRRFRDRFHVQPADPMDAARDTVAWAQREYGRKP
jgi:nucleoside-diphosphate-sugar epimerase